MKKNILSTILLLSCLGVTTASAAQTYETAHTYANNEDESGQISIPGASCMTVSLTGELENNYDFITIDGTQYTGALDKSFKVQKDSVEYHFTTDYSVTKDGVTLAVISCDTNDNNQSNPCITREELNDMIANEENVTEVNTSCITDMSRLFYSNQTFNQDISGWDVSNVTDMSRMFGDVLTFNQDISGWDVSNVTNMKYMFWMARDFNQDIGDWDVSNVTNMRFMFAPGFFSEVFFNQDIGDWNVSNVTTMDRMFYKTSFNQDIGDWDVSNVTNMDGMFYKTPFNQDIGDWNVSNVTNMSGMFTRTKNFNQDISSWNVSNVTDMSWMFYQAKNFNQNISGWNVQNVEDHERFREWSALQDSYSPF